MRNLYRLSGFIFPICVSPAIYAQYDVQDKHKPNIIFIITDQHRADAIGCSGNERIITPNIDALAADGYYFNNAYSSTPQ